MNLVEKLLKVDKGEFSKKKLKKIKSKVLSEIMGEEVVITIQSVSPKELLEISETGMDDEGEVIIGKTLDTSSLVVAAAVVDPPLKDEELMKHLGAATPADAALKLFKGEVNTIATKVNQMAGFGLEAEEVDEEIKN